MPEINLIQEEIGLIESLLEDKLLNEIEDIEEIVDAYSRLTELSIDHFPDMEEEDLLLTQSALKKIREVMEAENRRLYGDDD